MGEAVKEFLTAVKEHDADGNTIDERERIEFLHDGQKVVFFTPNPGQLSIMLNLGGRNMSPENFGVFIQFFFSVMDRPTQMYFRERMLDPEDSFSDMTSEGGMLEIFEYLSEQWSGGRPTKEPSDYQRSRRSTGNSSTAPSRAKASTSSTSRSRGSSR